MLRKGCSMAPVFIFLASTIFILSPLPSTASQIIVGCTKGVVDTHDTQFPQKALGQVPNRIANYEIVFQRGKYAIRISSRLPFIPLIYKKINGKYKDAGLSKQIKSQNDRNGRPFYYYDFYANHMTAIGNNYWLLQIKPTPSAQNTPHVIRVLTKPMACPDSRPNKSQCPPGYKLNPYGGTFGQAKCIKK